MTVLTDEEAQALFERAHQAVRHSREIRAGLHAGAHAVDIRRNDSRRAELRLVAEHGAALLRDVSRPIN